MAIEKIDCEPSKKSIVDIEKIDCELPKKSIVAIEKVDENILKNSVKLLTSELKIWYNILVNKGCLSYKGKEKNYE